MDTKSNKELPMPDWLANKYTSSTAGPLPPLEGGGPPPNRPSTKMAAASFKPKRRKRTTPVTPAPPADDPASDAATAGQTARGFFDDTKVSDSAANLTAGATSMPVDLSSGKVDRESSTAGQTVRRGFFDDSRIPESFANRRPGQPLEAAAALSSSSQKADRGPGPSPEADAVIDAGVGSGTPPAAATPPTTDSSKEAGASSEELSDVDISSEGYEGISFCEFSCLTSFMSIVIHDVKPVPAQLMRCHAMRLLYTGVSLCVDPCACVL